VLKNIKTGKIGGVEIKSSVEEFMRNRVDQSSKDLYINRYGAGATGQHSGLWIEDTIRILWDLK
jgi:hypothetical protein